MSRRKGATPSATSPTYIIVAVVFNFIFNMVVFYSGWHLLALDHIVSGQPASGWNWLLAARAMRSEIDRFSDDLEAKDKASGVTRFWGPYRRKALSNGTELAIFATIAFVLGWLPPTPAYSAAAFCAGAAIFGALLGVVQTAGRLRDRRWLAAIDDLATGVFCGGFFPMLAYALWFSSHSGPSDEIIWCAGIGICAAIGGGVNLWRKFRRDGQSEP